MARVMYLDCFSGAAGDMILAALLDAGLPADALRSALGSLGVDHEIRLARVMRAGIAATHVSVHGPEGGRADAHAHGHDHGHQHPHQHPHQQGDHHHAHEHGHAHGHDAVHEHGHAPGHRTLAEIAGHIGRSGLSEAGKARARALFQRIGEAEAAIHSMPLEQVHLHEVGALDSIIDIVGAVFAFEWFGIDDIVASPVNVGGGTVTIAHGTFPVPAPATLRLLAGVPIYSSGIQAELVTPTGALLVSDYASSYGPMPAMTVSHVGYGAGTRELGTVPNVLRVVIGDRGVATVSGGGEHAVVQIECDIDDMNPQLFGPVTDRLLAAGALDVFLTPVQMKKGRPGTVITVLAPSAQRRAVCDLLFRETTTIGVRFHVVERETLDRHWQDVTLPGGVVRIKVAGHGPQVLNAAPEFDDCLRIAEATGQPIKTVQAAAMRAWLERNSH